MGPHDERIALFTTLRFVAQRVPVVTETSALRRPGLAIRRTRYLGVIVDERVLTRGFAARERRGRLQALLLLRGTVHFGAGRPLGIGEALLLHHHHEAVLRFEDADFLEIDWDSERDVTAPTPLGVTVDGSALAAAFEAGDLPQRAWFALAFETFRRAGVPLDGLDAAQLQGAPSERDERLARAISAQLGNLTTADSSVVGGIAGLSPRQLQRVYSAFCETYRFEYSSWRDTRNRWRVQLAAVLLSRPDLSQADIAAEVGYRSTPALARAFAAAGFPPPSEMRRLVLRS